MKIEAGVMSFWFSNDCSLICKAERRHSDHQCQRKMRHLQFSRLGLTHVCACVLNVTHSHSHLISYWCLVRTQLRDTRGASLFNWLVLQNRRIELAGSETIYFFQFFFHFLFPKIQQEKEKKLVNFVMWIRSPVLLHIKMKVLIFQTSWKEPLDVMKTYGETFASKVLQMCSIWSTSVNKNLQMRNFWGVRIMCFNPQIMSHAHVGLWEKFNAASFKNKTQMHVYTVLHCN